MTAHCNRISSLSFFPSPAATVLGKERVWCWVLTACEQVDWVFLFVAMRKSQRCLYFVECPVMVGYDSRFPKEQVTKFEKATSSSLGFGMTLRDKLSTVFDGDACAASFCFVSIN